MNTLLVILVYIVALPAGLLLAVGIYWLLSPIHRLGSVGRWVARCVAGCVACEVFMASFLITGTGSVLSREGIAPGWREAMMIGIITGIGYATLWPFAESYHRSRTG